MQMCLLITNQCGVFRIHICILLLFVTYDVQSVWPDAKATIDSSNTLMVLLITGGTNFIVELYKYISIQISWYRHCCH